jgi:hypothetical protein
MSAQYVVDLPLPAQGYRLTANQIERFHEDRGLKITRDRVRIDDGRFFVRFSFVSRLDAGEFHSLFAGRAANVEPPSLALSLPKRARADDPLVTRSGNVAGVDSMSSS